MSRYKASSYVELIQRAANVKDFGAKGDGVTNDQPAFQAAIRASKTIFIPEGTYLIEPTASSGNFLLYLGTQGTAGNPTSRNGMTIFGVGNKSVIKLGNNVGANALLFSGATNDVLSDMVFRDFCVDLNGQNNLQANFTDPLRYNQAFYFYCQCTNFLFENLTIKNVSGSQGLSVGGNTAATYGKNIAVRHCVFDTWGLAIPNNHEQDCSVCYIQADKITVEDCVFTNPAFTFDLSKGHTAVEAHGDSSTKIRNNTFDNVQLPTLIASSQKATNNVEVAHNRMSGCNYFATLDPSSSDQKQVKFHHNTFVSTVANSSLVLIGQSGESSKDRENIEFSNNTIIGWNNTNEETHFIQVASSYLRSIRIQNNDVAGLNGSLIYISGQVMNTNYLDVTIQGNRMDSLGANGGATYPTNPTFVHVETSSGTINAVVIKDNVLYNSSAKNYGTMGLYKLSAPINYTFVDGSKVNFTHQYPLVLDGVTSPILKVLESYLNFGSATILSSGTSVVVTHGLTDIPTSIIVTPQANIGNVWVDTITSTQFTIHCSTAPGANTVVGWEAH